MGKPTAPSDAGSELKKSTGKLVAGMIKNLNAGAAENTKWMKSNGWDDKRLPSEQKTAGP